MTKSLTTLSLMLAILLFSSAKGWCADYQRGMNAFAIGDWATALREFRPLAEQGDKAAQYNMGQLYAHGKGVRKSLDIAIYWWRSSARQGDAYAQYQLGVAYLKGLGVPKDNQTALVWLRRAADQGVANAQSNLGYMYEKG